MPELFDTVQSYSSSGGIAKSYFLQFKVILVQVEYQRAIGELLFFF